MPLLARISNSLAPKIDICANYFRTKVSKRSHCVYEYNKVMTKSKVQQYCVFSAVIIYCLVKFQGNFSCF